jgi:branched-chain amino acid transport system ATP-binding protein
MLELQRLNKSFGALAVTQNLDLTVSEGELRAIIGPNGAGKTSLLAQIAGELAPDSGQIILRGENITSLSTPARCRAGIGRTYQISSVLRGFSTLDNVRLALQAHDGHSYRFFRDARRDRRTTAQSLSMLSRAGLEAKADVLAQHLAHGEQRQLEIAMALSSEPDLLLLDEPTAGMGRADSDRITGLIAELKGSTSIILVEHDMRAVFALADRITVLVGGRELMTGEPAEVRANASVRASYLGQSGDA